VEPLENLMLRLSSLVLHTLLSRIEGHGTRIGSRKGLSARLRVLKRGQSRRPLFPRAAASTGRLGSVGLSKKGKAAGWGPGGSRTSAIVSGGWECDRRR
jgi:hypothetical protein